MRRYSLLLLLLLTLSACTSRGVATPAPAALRIAGSTSMTAALNELAAAYQARQPHVLVDVRGGGSSAGVAELRRGAVDLAAVAWLAPDAAAPTGLNAVPVDRDAVAIIVHPENPVPGLTILQLRALYRGETLDWDTLGGDGGEPLLVSREDGSGTRAAFEALVMGGDRVTLNAIVMPNTSAVADYVARHRTAVGYVSATALNEGVRAVPVEGIAPAATSEAYHLMRTLYLYMPARPSREARAFVEFVLGPAGQAIIARHHAAIR
jgi:phosphate transport system substrate-binding protein